MPFAGSVALAWNFAPVAGVNCEFGDSVAPFGITGMRFGA
jgi:hypothetical protein